MCRSGCADCCGKVAFLTVAAFEAQIIRRYLAQIDDAERARLVTLASRKEETGCVMLDDDARCSIYPARPLVCRAFGLPYRVLPDLAWPDGKRRLPVVDGVLEAEEQVVDTCFKNFMTVRPNELPAEMVIHQLGLTSLSKSLDAAEPSDVSRERTMLSAVIREALGIETDDAREERSLRDE